MVITDVQVVTRAKAFLAEYKNVIGEDFYLKATGYLLKFLRYYRKYLNQEFRSGKLTGNLPNLVQRKIVRLDKEIGKINDTEALIAAKTLDPAVPLKAFEEGDYAKHYKALVKAIMLEVKALETSKAA